jgi:plastocyanin domain-containing protein
MTVLVNLLGLGLIALIVWWFWLSESKAAKAAENVSLTILVDGGAYAPDRIEVAAGQPVRLTFIRKDASPCAAQVVFSDLDMSFDLALDAPTEVKLPALKPGEHLFTCQMGMYRGLLIAT